MPSYDPEFESRQHRAEHFLRAATYGPLCVILLMAARMLHGDAPGTPAFPVVFVALLASLGSLEALRRLFVDRKADEYVASLWNRGTTAAFITMVGWLFLATAGNLLARDFGAPALLSQLFTHALGHTFDVAMLAFFLGLNWPRLRGEA